MWHCAPSLSPVALQPVCVRRRKRPRSLFDSQLDGRPIWPMRVCEQRAAERNQIDLVIGDQGVGLSRFADKPAGGRGIPTSPRMRSATGAMKAGPQGIFAVGVEKPTLTSMISRPAALKRRTISMPASRSSEPSNSVTPKRAASGRFSRHTFRTAARVSSRNLARPRNRRHRHLRACSTRSNENSGRGSRGRSVVPAIRSRRCGRAAQPQRNRPSRARYRRWSWRAALLADWRRRRRPTARWFPSREHHWQRCDRHLPTAGWRWPCGRHGRSGFLRWPPPP